MRSLRASADGIKLVDQARKRQGWTKTKTVTWWQEAHTSESTLKRFWRGEPVQRETFIKICQVVGLLDWQAIAELDSGLPAVDRPMPFVDWSTAPELSSFYGRQSELATLLPWLLGEMPCRLVALLGMGGIGKTALAVKLLQEVVRATPSDESAGTIGVDRQGNLGFDSIIWRSLQMAPALSDLVLDLMGHLAPNLLPEISSPGQSAAEKDWLALLLQQLHQQRVLVVLDGWEAILGGDRAGCYRPGYELYGDLLQRVGQERHRSCLLITSREKPDPITGLEGKTAPVRSWQLAGLGEAAQDLLAAKGLVMAGDAGARLIAMYGGNPLALNLIANLIQTLFNGSIQQFLRANTIVVGQLEPVLAQQMNYLSPLERQILTSLAHDTSPMTLARLRSQVTAEVSQSLMLEALLSLEQRSLMEKIYEDDDVLFTLQPIVMKYIRRTSRSATER